MTQFIKIYYKISQVFITKCDSFITKCDSYDKVRQFYYKMLQLSQNVASITKYNGTTMIAKGLLIVTRQTENKELELVTFTVLTLI